MAQGWSFILVLVALALLVPIIIIIFIILVKGHKLRALLLALKILPTTSAFPIDSFLVLGLTTPAVTTSTLINSSCTSFSFITTAILMFLCGCMILLLIFHIYKASSPASFNLSFSNGTSIVTVRVCYSAIPPQNFHLTTTQNIANVSISGRYFPILQWDDPGYVLFNILDRSSKKLPNKAKLTLFQAMRLRGMLSGPFSVYITATIGYREFLFPVCSSQCPICQSAPITPERRSHNITPRPSSLYPPLTASVEVTMV